ncbi:LysR family transcriptional regulator [Erythrobacter sp. JK5]|uniref:LysR family transcriptional regulator n=1 Tax=Erythrobacter sp. JK5 TaxID=2829500 RepID=UPI001BAA906B|nr:LysR family transcriptional regulator [Erythrobacter sp. JK5]QUL38358.1 LysR family transcriptional regulator [Erythrobacter sp. JK5]
MDITTFRTFLAAAATGSFAGAAQRVHASPSSVTERIKQLEFRLGTKLFVRDKRGCELTSAGRRFLVPARQAVRAWEFAQHEVALPDRFARSITFGGQYFLWDGFLIQWLAEVSDLLPDLAIRATAGAWTRLNRDLAEGALDIIVVHDPIFRRDIGAEPLFQDQLVMVTGGDPEHWRDHFVRIDWGRSLGVEIASRLDIVPQAGLVLDLGSRSTNWLIQTRMAGYMPLKSVENQIESGQLSRVADAPEFEFPAFVCWRRDLDAQLAAEVVLSLKSRFNSDIPN